MTRNPNDEQLSFAAGVANLMVNATDSQLAFCPAASSEVVVLDVHSGSRSFTWAALGRQLDSQTSTQGSLVETSWAADGTALLRTCNGSICATTEYVICAPHAPYCKGWAFSHSCILEIPVCIRKLAVTVDEYQNSCQMAQIANA